MDAVALRARIADGGALVAGVLSGTSADGIDVALVRVRAARSQADGAAARDELARPELIAFETLPFADGADGADGIGARVRAVLDGAPLDLAGVALLDRDLGRAFGRAVREVCRRAGIAPDLVGSHGQTVWHHDGAEASGPATLQLGDLDEVAVAAAAPVVGDFRMGAIARGGEGAPLCSLVDDDVYPPAPRPAAVLNLGGIANVTWLGDADERGAPVAADDPRRSFDIGPAGALLDGLARRLLGRAFDEDGAAAARGTRLPELERAFLAHPFMDRSPPKSTGRDTFGEAWLDGLAARHAVLGDRARADDVLASAAAAVARSVADALARFAPAPPRVVWLAGGGARNAAVVAALGRALASPLESSAEAGVDPDAREAIAFALLAVRRVLGTSPLGKCAG